MQPSAAVMPLQALQPRVAEPRISNASLQDTSSSIMSSSTVSAIIAEIVECTEAEEILEVVGDEAGATYSVVQHDTGACYIMGHCTSLYVTAISGALHMAVCMGWWAGMPECLLSRNTLHERPCLLMASTKDEVSRQGKPAGPGVWSSMEGGCSDTTRGNKR